MQKFVNNLKRQIEENPVVAIGAIALLFTATAKLMDANTARKSAAIHALEVNRRIMMGTRR